MKKQKGEEGKKGKYSGILAFLSLLGALRVVYSRLLTALQEQVNNSQGALLLMPQNSALC